jgi:hypothetical protein
MALEADHAMSRCESTRVTTSSSSHDGGSSKTWDVSPRVWKDKVMRLAACRRLDHRQSALGDCCICLRVVLFAVFLFGRIAGVARVCWNRIQKAFKSESKGLPVDSSSSQSSSSVASEESSSSQSSVSSSSVDTLESVDPVMFAADETSMFEVVLLLLLEDGVEVLELVLLPPEAIQPELQVTKTSYQDSQEASFKAQLR